MGIGSPRIRHQAQSTPRKAAAEASTKGVVATIVDLLDQDDLQFLTSSVWPTLEASATDLTAVDLFCGCGGLTLGAWEAARRAGFRLRPVLGCDFSDSQLAVYGANFGSASAKKEDLSQMSSLLGSAPTPLELRLFRPLRGTRIDFLLAGPPCQGHSNLNNHTRRVDPKNELYSKVARAAELLEPMHVLIENVPAVLNDHGSAVSRTVDALKSLGYVVQHAVVDMTNIGVAQTRKRHLLVATRATNDGTDIEFDRLTARFRTPTRSLRWAIEDLVEVADGGLMHDVPGMAELTKQRVDYLFDNDLYDLPDSQRPDCHRIKAHTYQSVYGRMRWDTPAPTITGGFMTVGRGRFVHPARRRTLTPREAARVQFFPDFFDFSPLTTRKAVAEAIGNAVPPKMSMVFAAALIELSR